MLLGDLGPVGKLASVTMSTNSARRPYDGKLAPWEQIEDAESWDGLILGNGASINLWADFGYVSLFEQAKESRLFSRNEEALFEKLGVENFEAVLHSLWEAIRVGEALGLDRALEVERHASIQKALAKAVQRVHVSGGEIPEETFDLIRTELRNYRFVFSTSYDLLIYWSAAKGPSPFAGFVDFLWAKDCNAFDEGTIWLPTESERTRLFFLHGALHLVVLSDGTTCKRKASLRTLLDQFGEPFRGDRAARPLIVTEARAADKVRSIDGNAYLAYCWKSLRTCEAPLAIFGHSLRDQDHHLVDALNVHPERPLAVSLRNHGRKRNRREQHRISSLLDAERLYFFDAETYPLGSKDLALKEPRWGKRILSRGHKLAQAGALSARTLRDPESTTLTPNPSASPPESRVARIPQPAASVA